MKTPLWEESPGALAALLNAMRSGSPGSSFVKAHLYTFALAGGGQIAITDADLDITAPVGAVNWSSKGVRVDVDSSRATGHWKRGLDVDTWNVTLAPRATDEITGAAFPDKIGTVPFVQACAQGALDGALVYVDRAYLAAWPQPWTQKVTPVGILRMFVGKPATVDIGDITVAIVLNDIRQILQTQMPIGVFQAECRHTLFDAGCTLLASSFAVAGSCIGGSTRAVLKSAVAAPAGSGTYTLGKIVMTSGANSGYSRTVRQWVAGSLSLLNPLPFDVIPGDTFNAYPGCDRQQATCTAFANLVNFGGESYIPAAETAV